MITPTQSIINIALSASCINNPVCLFTSAPNIWFPIVLLGVLVVISVVAIIYALGPLLGRNDIKIWARAKIYDALVTIVLAIIFLSFSTALYSTDPTSLYSAIGIIPKSCIYPSSISQSPTNLYSISLCDIYTFNQNVASFSTSVFWMSVLLDFTPSISGSFPTGSVTPINARSYGTGISYSVSLLPIVLVHQYIVPFMTAYFVAVLASQVLQVLLSAAMLIFSVFLILGLLARSFGVTKSFGGSMIAFGLGLGFVYPLVVSISYGFLNVVIENVGNAAFGIGSLSGLSLFIFNAVPLLISSVFSGSLLNGIETLFTPVIFYSGFIAAGLLIIPLLNLVIVDAFISDFSRSIGERMDLFSILTRII